MSETTQRPRRRLKRHDTYLGGFFNGLSHRHWAERLGLYEADDDHDDASGEGDRAEAPDDGDGALEIEEATQ